MWRISVVSLAVLLFASTAAPQGPIDRLTTGARVRVWSERHNVRGQTGTVKWRRGDTLRVRPSGRRDLEEDRDREVDMRLVDIDSLEVSIKLGRRGGPKGALMGFLVGGLVGAVAGAVLKADAEDLAPWMIPVFGISGAFVGTIAGFSERERWEGVPLRGR
jgi:hypothetical protein